MPLQRSEPPTPTAALNALLDDPGAPARVQQMSSVALHGLITSIGRADASELVAMATPEQVRELVDLEIWQGDRIDQTEALDWLHLVLTQLPLEQCGQILRTLDVELVGHVLLSHMRIHMVDEDDELPEDPDGSYLPTPDGWFVLELLAEDSATLEQLTEVVDRLYRVDHEEARRLLQNLTGELPAELEEWSYRWRNGRLQDLGFADPEEALLIYAYLDPRSVRPDEQTADRPLVNDPEPVGSGALVLIAPPAAESFWSQAMTAISDPAERQRISAALATVSNRALAADRVAPADLDAARVSMEALHWRLSMGLEYLCRGEVDRAGPVLAGVALLRIARVGHSLVLDRRRRVAAEARRGTLGRRPGQLDLLDRPLRNQLDGLLAIRPTFHDAARGTNRPFHCGEDLLLADRWCQEAEAVSRLVPAMRLPSPLPPGVTYGDLFRSSLVNHLAGREPLQQALDRDTLRAFLRQHASGDELGAEVTRTALALVPDDDDARALAGRWVSTLGRAVASLDPEKLDLRFVDGLWVTPPGQPG